jgi:hypothetical protein
MHLCAGQAARCCTCGIEAALDTLEVVAMPVHDRYSIDSFSKFFRVLPRSDDASLVILKLHLLVEEVIRGVKAGLA